MSKEIQQIIELFHSTYDGDPWFGKSMMSILNEIDSTTAMQKPIGQHSIRERFFIPRQIQKDIGIDKNH